MLLPEEELEIFSEILTSSVCEKIILSLETEIPLSEVEILLSSEQITLSLDQMFFMIELVIIPLHEAITKLGQILLEILFQLRTGPSSSELRRDSRSVCLRLLSQVAWRLTVWFNLEMIQKRVL